MLAYPALAARAPASGVGQESADLGGLLHAFRRAGASPALLCLTRGEASPLNSTCERLETIRPWELQAAAGILGVSSVIVSDFPDRGLDRRPVPSLTERVGRAISGGGRACQPVAGNDRGQAPVGLFWAARNICAG